MKPTRWRPGYVRATCSGCGGAVNWDHLNPVSAACGCGDVVITATGDVCHTLTVTIDEQYVPEDA